ncbi:hypothetical protein O3P69_006667 [Scylla paramamosain]|uniref:Uncharacterized protein n=1 Tax=Scylla paramamosain TaxID=85552 RepID=A0AAW0U161_SCYPA
MMKEGCEGGRVGGRATFGTERPTRLSCPDDTARGGCGLVLAPVWPRIWPRRRSGTAAASTHRKMKVKQKAIIGAEILGMGSCEPRLQPARPSEILNGGNTRPRIYPVMY